MIVLASKLGVGVILKILLLQGKAQKFHLPTKSAFFVLTRPFLKIEDFVGNKEQRQAMNYFRMKNNFSRQSYLDLHTFSLNLYRCKAMVVALCNFYLRKGVIEIIFISEILAQFDLERR